jgi:uncharacterized RDD family membrane protein YckC
MELWVIQEGEKTGPFNDYEVRDRIESGELGPETRVWHEGAAGWTRLAEVDIFRSEFEGREEESLPTGLAPPPLPNPPRPFLRFMARWFDFFLYVLVVFSAMRLLGFDLAAALMSPMFVALHLGPWVALEAIAVHLWGTTPGKWLLGFRVQRPDGSRLGLAASILRAFRVFVLGMGMNMSFFVLIAHGFGIWFLLRFGEAAWDRMGGCETRQLGLRVTGIVGFVVGGFVMMMVLGAVLQPASIEIEKEMREMYPRLFEMFPPRPDAGA